MTFQYSLNPQVAALGYTISKDGIIGILGAGRIKTATFRKDWRDQPLIKGNQC